MPSRQGKAADGERKTRVAIIGTGLAGLTTAYLLHRDSQKRYEVTLFEQAPKFSLDAASVTIKNTKTGTAERIDIPPRSFCRGYYANLCRMYDHLGVPFQHIQLIWVFARISAAAQTQVPSPEDVQTMPGSYFVYGKRLHEMLLISPHFWRGSVQTILQTLYLAICHIWFFAACFLLAPRMIKAETYLDVKSAAKDKNGTASSCESFRQYLDRIRLPQTYALYYLLPVLSIICSCSYAEMLDFPASDVTEFVKGSFLRKTYVARGGINRVQATLAAGIEDVRLETRVTKVDRVDEGVLIRSQSVNGDAAAAAASSEEVFDRVVLAVSPNVAAAIFNPSKPLLSVIPTVPVTSTVVAPLASGLSVVPEKTHVPSGECSYRRGDAQVMAFRTTFSESVVQTETLHYLSDGLVVRTSPVGDAPALKGTLDTARFTRTLRTTESRSAVQRLLGPTKDSDGECVWTNGKDDVWVVGSWCWDGMVLLEGCVVSAMRVARDLGVEVPWER
ncbi:hypothetical protein MKX07_003065 [Trichoderma sp. CBMAI-0711]|uniref:Amine oxidase domain-containing protein n=1 Tax=Trichoderma parareesei TaxID=858221 RepID=A0A2H2ZV88_TRIPA|nr:hypothetical protein MKX07_003065 [Trichoderma sp. CBMAI-0711]OTA05916.1 hypothetical protein A9Z42_0066320 [Trichoderma parareesei]